MEQTNVRFFMNILEALERSEDPARGDELTLSDILQRELFSVAQELRIAAFSGKAVVYPTPFPINPTKEMFFTSFDMDTSHKEHDYVRHVAIGANGYCEIRVCPGEGADWQAEEMELKLKSISRFLEILLERRLMFENISRLASIDMSSGLFNSIGLRDAGGKLLSTEHAEDYAGIFLNLKDTKLVAHKYDERMMAGFLTSVSHKLFSFLDSELEIASHFGGDNFYVLLLKERLHDFQQFLADAVAEVRNGEETVQIPFFARMGIYEGNDHDQIGVFMNNATVAFQATRRTGQDVVVFRPELLAQMD